MINEQERLSHPSFGQISFSRVTGSASFYGSELNQDHYIEMTVQKSEVSRDLTRDWYYGKEVPLAKVRMTSGQFAELITSMNKGAGVPCTVEWIGQSRVEDMPEQESRKEFIHRKFEDRMKEFANRIKENQQKAKDIIKKKTLSKQDIHDLNMTIETLSNEVAGNIPFFAKCFQENMDQVIFEAKTEVENAIQHKINVLGLSALHEQNKLLS